MKKTDANKIGESLLNISKLQLSSKEKEALQAALKVLDEQSEKLGLLDPMEAEPAVFFFAEEGKR